MLGNGVTLVVKNRIVMKNLLYFLLLTGFFSFALDSCGTSTLPIQVKIEKYTLPYDSIPYDPESFIVILDQDDKENEALRNSLSTGGYTVTDSCSCTPEILLYGHPDFGLDSVERVKKAVATTVEREGTGSAGLNYYLRIPDEQALPPGSLNWDKTYKDDVAKSKEIILSIIDAGLDENQGGIGSRLLSLDTQEECSVYRPFSSYPVGQHGTKVAMSSLHANSTFEHKYVYDLRFLDFNVFSEDNGGSFFKALCAIQRSVQNKPDAIVMSWGFPLSNLESANMFDSIAENNTLIVFHKVLMEAELAGIPMIAAAGNDSMDIGNAPFYPASFSGDKELRMLLTVGALDHGKSSKASYSNYGDPVKLYASGAIDLFDGKHLTGTSYAAPKVGAAAAIVHHQNQGNRDDLIYLLNDLGFVNPSSSSRLDFGTGILRRERIDLSLSSSSQ